MPSIGFERIERVPIPSLGVTYERWRHPCGATHLHLACADQHRSFSVAFRTPPDDDRGLPHILEHTALCGSRRYPVRDPFFKMLRRSLQTFMNAVTFPDMTAYPFASQVDKDFTNLLAIYLDAAFRPNLDPLDFAQEGHRLERIEGLEGEADRWQRKGVVFNEMKGAMDSTDAQVEQACARALLGDTIYHFNSGGEPEAIPLLTHADLVAFHRRCYRPANACFATYGDFAPERLHAALADYIADDAGVPLPAPLPQPVTALKRTLRVPVPQAAGQDEREVASARIAWAWGDAADLDEALTGELIDRLLLGHAGAPLRHALESSDIGRSIDGSGYAAHYRSGMFSAQMDGLAVADYGRFAALVDTTIAGIATTGVPADELAAALHQLELTRREVGGDSYPFGLELC
ncbi:MAG: insulinase family protein, partial [Planctomycetes bacterium]|nr:insulinase family protein [Planctomycetota bacterium]